MRVNEMKLVTCLLISTLAVTAGCASSDSPEDHLLGAWQSGKNDVIDFQSNGTMVYDEDGVVQEARYSVEGSMLTIDFRPNSSKGIRRMSTGFYADEHRLAMPAAYPEGDVAGILGKWRFNYFMEYYEDGKIETFEMTRSFEFMDDDTVAVVTGDKLPILETGTYEIDGEVVAVTIDGNVDLYTFVNGEALAEENDVSLRAK